MLHLIHEFYCLYNLSFLTCALCDILQFATALPATIQLITATPHDFVSSLSSGELILQFINHFRTSGVTPSAPWSLEPPHQFVQTRSARNFTTLAMALYELGVATDAQLQTHLEKPDMHRLV